MTARPPRPRRAARPARCGGPAARPVRRPRRRAAPAPAGTAPTGAAPGPAPPAPGRPPTASAVAAGRYGRTGDGRASSSTAREHDLDHLPGGALPDHRPDGPAHVTGLPAVPYRPVHVAEHPAGQRRVEEDRPVAVGHRGAQRQPDAERPGDQPPPPGAADVVSAPMPQRRGHRRGVDQAQPGQERAGAQPPQQHADQTHPAEVASQAQADEPGRRRDRRERCRWRPVTRGASSKILSFLTYRPVDRFIPPRRAGRRDRP